MYYLLSHFFVYFLSLSRLDRSSFRATPFLIHLFMYYLQYSLHLFYHPLSTGQTKLQGYTISYPSLHVLSPIFSTSILSSSLDWIDQASGLHHFLFISSCFISFILYIYFIILSRLDRSTFRATPFLIHLFMYYLLNSLHLSYHPLSTG